MSRKSLLVLGVGFLLGFGLTLSAGADETGLERPGFALSTLDSAGEVGQDTSVTIGADRLGLISYYDATNGNLKVAHCPTSSAFLPTAAAEQLGITESHHSKNGVTESLPVRKKKDNTPSNREILEVGSF